MLGTESYERAGWAGSTIRELLRHCTTKIIETLQRKMCIASDPRQNANTIDTRAGRPDGISCENTNDSRFQISGTTDRRESENDTLPVGQRGSRSMPVGLPDIGLQEAFRNAWPRSPLQYVEACHGAHRKSRCERPNGSTGVHVGVTTGDVLGDQQRLGETNGAIIEYWSEGRKYV